jgi:hypothetical protein
VVLSYDIDGTIGSILTEDQLAKANLEFLGIIVNSNYEVNLLRNLTFKVTFC